MQRKWTKDEETERLSAYGKDVGIQCQRGDETLVLINRDNLFIFEDVNFDKCWNQITLYKP